MIQSFMGRPVPITSFAIEDLSILPTDLSWNAITSGKINALAVSTGKIDWNAVTSGKINAGAVSTGKIDSLAVMSGHLDWGSVTSGKLGPGGVQSGNIGAQAVLTSNLNYDIQIKLAHSPDGLLAQEDLTPGWVARITTIGKVSVADCNTTGAMPAVGIVANSPTSGVAVHIVAIGEISASIYNFSGYVGDGLYVGNSGLLKPRLATVVKLSGLVQEMGFVINHSTIFVSRGGLYNL